MWQRTTNVVSTSSLKHFIQFLFTVTISTNVVSDALSSSSSPQLSLSSACEATADAADAAAARLSSSIMKQPHTTKITTANSSLSRGILHSSSNSRILVSSTSSCVFNKNESDDDDDDDSGSATEGNLRLQQPSPAMVHNIMYERMKTPQRCEAKEHAIFGSLYGDTLLEKYEIWKRKPRQQQQQQIYNCNNYDDDNDDDDDNRKKNENSTTAADKNENVVIANIKFGNNLNGHIGIVHGGIIGLLFDDVCGFAFHALGVQHAVTANLNVNFRKPVMANSEVCLSVQLDSTKTEGRKLYFNVQMTSNNNNNNTLQDDDDDDNDDKNKILYAEATCLYIIPRDH